MHPPKIEKFDVAGMTNTDPKGIARVVDHYSRTDFGLYMARAVDGHPTIAYFRSWLLPALGLRVSRWNAHPGTSIEHDFYIDIVDIDIVDVPSAADRDAGPDGSATHDPGRWRTMDLYLDIVVREHRDLRVLDTDELLAARSAGLVGDAVAQRAFERAFAAVEGVAAAGYDVDGWLRDAHGILLTWPESQ